MVNVKFTLNDEVYSLDVKPSQTLLDLIREQLGLTGTKEGCGSGDCGACTVLVDGQAVNSCIYLAVDVDGKEVTTIEGISKKEGIGKEGGIGKDGLHPLQEAFIEEGAVQCGYCSPGFIMTAKALLEENPTPNEEEIKQGIAGNLCRCTGYVRIVKAIKTASQKIAAPKKGS